jgi:hypothetical protein
MLNERPANQRIYYVGSQQLPKHEVAHGDSVTLKTGNQIVLVSRVHAREPYGFSGEIQGFEPSGAEEYAGMKVGERIDFSERNVYTCRRS